jgi:hypothetical protein
VRNLWAAVVNQAFDDLRELAYGSVDYEQSVQFLTGRGEWASWREQVADYLELHPDDIRRAGLAVIQTRHRADGGPIKKIVPPPTAPAPTLVVSHEIAVRPTLPDIRHRLDPKRVQGGLKKPWWLKLKSA